MIDSTLSSLQSSLAGNLIVRGDHNYDEVRKVYNGMVDKYPEIIAQCRNVNDVVTCVNYARNNDLLLAIRGGGHNGAGLGICDKGMVIDLSLMNKIKVDPNAKTAWVEAGSLLRDVDLATHEHGLALPSGIIGTTGVSGLTLGGGLGYLTRQYGLTIDSMLEAEVVLANGERVTASATRNSDLFWALRGGGGNFGVVVSFLFQLHPVDNIYGGPILWELSEAKDVLEWYRSFITNAPDHINGFFEFLTVPPGPPFPEHLHLKKMCGIVWCYTGPLEDAEIAFKPIRTFKKPALDFASPMPFPVIQSLFDGLYPPGLQWYWKADFFKELTDAAIERHLEFADKLPTMHSSMHLYPVNGAAARIDKTATAWNFRDAVWAEVIVGVDPDPANRNIITEWTREYWEALHPYSAGGAYVNFLMEEGEDRVKATYADNYSRLAEIKAHYDPGNLFKVNQNIKPAEKELM
jgi:FAD/FMN-containing dehydrogenase